MLNLLGKVSFDASGFTQGMSKMKAAAGPAGKEIGQQIRGKMLEAFGAGAAIALFKKTIQNAVDIRKGMGATGLDSATFQALKVVADQSGASVEELAKAMEGTGSGADELREAVEAAKAEMESTGRIIDSETVDRLADLGDKMDALLGRLAPAVAMVVDFLSKIYDWVDRMVKAAVAGGQILFGKITGDQAQVQAGRESAREAFAPSTQREESAVRRAARVAAEVTREERNSGASGTRAATDKGPQVSSLVAAGAIFNRSLGADSPQQKTLDTMKNEIARIRSIIEKGGI